MNGNIDFKSKQRYLDSIWNKPVYTLLSDYTYKEIKESELNLGLDLQGGMHVTLEVSPVDLLKGLSSNNQDKDFLEAIQKAKKNIIGTQLNFITEFYNEFKTLAPDKKLSTIFSTVSNRGRIDFDSTDDEIIDMMRQFLIKIGEKGSGDGYCLCDDNSLFTIEEIAKMFSNNINYLPEQKGNRKIKTLIILF